MIILFFYPGYGLQNERRNENLVPENMAYDHGSSSHDADIQRNGTFLEQTNMDSIISSIILENKLNEIPVDIIRLAHNEKFLVLQMDLPEDLTGIIMVDAVNTLLDTDSQKIIIVDSKLSSERQRFVIAHELGHYFLEYKGKGNKGSLVHQEIRLRGRNKKELEKERQAEKFARCLLMPYNEIVSFIKKRNAVSPSVLQEDISQNFWVSGIKAKDRYNELFNVVEE